MNVTKPTKGSRGDECLTPPAIIQELGLFAPLEAQEVSRG